MDRCTKLDCKEYILCFFIAIVASLRFSLCPLFNQVFYTDSSVFYYIGTMMHNGFMPYRDLFDHKGPILYLIQYVGAALNINGYTGSGIWLLELISLSIFTVFSLKIAKFFSHNLWHQYITVLVVPVFLAAFTYEGGNLTEEYALPAIAIALYLFLKYILDDYISRFDSFILGLTVVYIFMLRPNMIAVWLFFMVYICISLLSMQKFKKLINLLVYYFAGVFLLGGVVILYLMHNDALKPMIEYYWLFNLEYSKNQGVHLINNIRSMFSLLKCNMFILPFVLYGLIINFKNKVYVLMVMAFIVSLGMACMSGRGYYHYGMVLVPFYSYFIIIACNTLFSHHVKINTVNERWLKFDSYKVVLGLCLVSFLGIYGYKTALFKYREYKGVSIVNPIVTYMKQNTSKSDDVLLLGNACNNYLQADRYTKNKFFYQLPPINISDKLCNEFLDEFERKRSDVIIVPSYLKNRKNQNICKLLDKLVILKKNNEYSLKEYETFDVYTKVRK